jgi:hypothetical protein
MNPDAPRALTTYVPLTTQDRGSKYEVKLPRLSFLREEGGGSLVVTRLERWLGDVPAEASDCQKRLQSRSSSKGCETLGPGDDCEKFVAIAKLFD